LDKDERGLFEAMLHRLQIMRQESEQQTVLLRQLCQAMDGLGSELSRMCSTIDANSQIGIGMVDGRVRGRGRRLPGSTSLSAQTAIATDLLAKAALNGSGKSAGK
jgi:hypothetical protein